MKPVASLAVCLAAITPLASAWPKWLPDVDALVVRQDDSEPSASPTPTPEPSASASGDDNDEDTASATGPRRTNLNTASLASGSGSGSGTGTGSRSTQTEFDPEDPVASIVMVTPAPTDPGLRLYKINDIVTFGWNYTNLQATPTAIDVLVSCSVASATWTLTQNMTWESEGAYTWDSSEQATAVQSPLLTEEYTLIIFDSDLGIDSTPEPGYLGTFDQFTFDMYEGRPYKPLNEWNCPTCSSAPPSLGSQALGFAVTMGVVAVASFTWFVAGLAI